MRGAVTTPDTSFNTAWTRMCCHALALSAVHCTFCCAVLCSPLMMMRTRALISLRRWASCVRAFLICTPTPCRTQFACGVGHAGPVSARGACTRMLSAAAARTARAAASLQPLHPVCQLYPSAPCAPRPELCNPTRCAAQVGVQGTVGPPHLRFHQCLQGDREGAGQVQQGHVHA